MNDEFEQQEEEDSELKSKSQVKRDMDELQKLGVKLMGLNKHQLPTIPLTDYILVAIEESKRINSHEAKRRHAQYLGKLIRNTDFEAIIEAVELLDPSSESFARFHQQIEKWRDKMASDLSVSMSEFLDQYPKTDRQHLRQLGKNAEKELKNKPDVWTSRKKLFQFIKEVVNSHSK